MADYTTVRVYIRAEDVRLLKSKGKEPDVWTRGLVRFALERMRDDGVREPGTGGDE
jgi:hypothetical protein